MKYIHGGHHVRQEKKNYFKPWNINESESEIGHKKTVLYWNIMFIVV